MISVIIPVLNEESTIGNIVKFVKKQPSVKEVIVVDDRSLDNTVAEAKKAGAKVITSTKLGKGASMRDGLLVSKGKVVVYLDGDVHGYSPKIIKTLTEPIIKKRADFVKGAFDRDAGRVTELVAKPLLSITVPELASFKQPLSGMIAGKREFLEKINFENDYGVDIGILIDMYLLGARVDEVSIGKIDHKMKSWRQLGKMSREVSRAILKRATNGTSPDLDSLGKLDILRDQMDFSIKEALLKMKKMIVLDMDNTILNGSFIDTAAKTLGFNDELEEIRSQNTDNLIITKHIANLLKNISLDKIIEIADSIPLVKDVETVLKKLRKRGYIIGIVSYSYDCVTTHIKNKVGADFDIAHELEFSDSIATGEVKIPSFFIHNENSKCSHKICKMNALIELSKKYGIKTSNIIAVGDGNYDQCMIKNAGVGVSFCSKSKELDFLADRWIKTKSFKPLLRFAR